MISNCAEIDPIYWRLISWISEQCSKRWKENSLNSLNSFERSLSSQLAHFLKSNYSLISWCDEPDGMLHVQIPGQSPAHCFLWRFISYGPVIALMVLLMNASSNDRHIQPPTCKHCIKFHFSITENTWALGKPIRSENQLLATVKLIRSESSFDVPYAVATQRNRGSASCKLKDETITCRRSHFTQGFRISWTRWQSHSHAEASCVKIKVQECNLLQESSKEECRTKKDCTIYIRKQWPQRHRRIKDDRRSYFVHTVDMNPSLGHMFNCHPNERSKREPRQHIRI